MRLLYELALHSYNLIIFLASFFNKKAELWIEGRKDVFKKLKGLEAGNWIWIHCASLGEFEQGRPIIEALKTNYPNNKILLTFFSPSGYEIRKNFPMVDHIAYLPLDTKKNAKKFLDLVQPKFVIFVKYEFWHNYFFELNKRKISLFLVSSIFRKDQIFFKWYGGFFKKVLSYVSHFFVQDQQSEKLLQSLELNNVTITGDTRFDRVYKNSLSLKPIDLIEKFRQNHKIIVAGSTWPQDEELLINLLNSGDLMPGFKIIIAPHEIENSKIESLYKGLAKWNPVRFSTASEDLLDKSNVLIIDNIGMLSSLYSYADYAYIGGGFGKGIHNILEAAVFGIPVFFGPNYKKFNEASDLIDLKNAFSIKTSEELLDKLVKLNANPIKLQEIKTIASQYFRDNTGATNIVLNYLKK